MHPQLNDRRREKVVSKQPLASLSKSKFIAILRVLCQNRIDLVISNFSFNNVETKKNLFKYIVVM